MKGKPTFLIEINYIFNEKSNQIPIRSVLIYELIVPDT